MPTATRVGGRERGTVGETYTTTVFGAVRSHDGACATGLTFTGEQNDPNGVEYLRARYYEPGTGRFLSRDPLGGGVSVRGWEPSQHA